MKRPTDSINALEDRRHVPHIENVLDYIYYLEGVREGELSNIVSELSEIYERLEALEAKGDLPNWLASWAQMNRPVGPNNITKENNKVNNFDIEDIVNKPEYKEIIEYIRTSKINPFDNPDDK